MFVQFYFRVLNVNKESRILQFQLIFQLIQMSLKSLSIPYGYQNALLSTRHGRNDQNIEYAFSIVKSSMEPAFQQRESKISHWSNKQKQNFVIFVSYFKQALAGQSFHTCNWSIFKGLATLLKTRNAQQCRSHFLKMLKQYGSLDVFIKVALQKISCLSQKMAQAQNQLIQIQKQFLLRGVAMSENVNSLNCVEVIDSFPRQSTSYGFQEFTEKPQKDSLLKTAADYQQNENPVKINNNHYSVFSSKSEFKPMNNIKPKTQRSSIKSFVDDQIKPQVPVPMAFTAPPLRDEIKCEININNQIQQNNSALETLTENKSMSNMKELIQIHYLYQLWTSKLEKLIREGNLFQSLNNMWQQN